MRDEGRCVLLSSHLMQEIETLCDRIIVLDHGRVQANGTAEALRRTTGETNLEEAFMSATRGRSS